MIHRNVKTGCAAVAAVVVLGACNTINTSVREDIEQNQVTRKKELDVPLQVAPVPRVTEVTGSLMPVTPVTSPTKGAWLKQYRVKLDIRSPLPMSAVVSKLAEQGINITSDLPLDSYMYLGKVNMTDGEAALHAVLGSVGLDYQVDDARKIVQIKPMSSQTWFLSIGNRKSSYASDGVSSSGTTSGNTSGGGTSGATNSSGTSGNGSNSATGSNSSQTTGTTNSGSTSSGQSSSTSTSTSSGTGVASADDFWASLATELSSRLSVMVPRSMASSMGGAGMSSLPPLPGGVPNTPMPAPVRMGGSGGDANELYVKRQIGSYAINPETGSIVVQAPHWVLSEMDAYIKRIQEMYNTDISFRGEIVLVTSNRADSEGFDVAAFASWAAGKYGMAVANNALGGVTVSVPTDGSAPSIQAGAQPVGGPLLGLTYSGSNSTIDVFNAYLSQLGKVSVIQRPLITTTSGVPGIFSKKYTDYYNTVSQQAASAGTGNAATATTNQLVTVDLGTELRINPRIDISTGLIRAQLTLNQTIKSGTKIVPQTITYSDKSSTVNTSIPILTKQNVSGEILLRDGDLIVVGGQTEEGMSADENGIPGKDGPMGGLLGTKYASRTTQTYYFALRVAVSKRK